MWINGISYTVVLYSYNRDTKIKKFNICSEMINTFDREAQPSACRRVPKFGPDITNDVPSDNFWYVGLYAILGTFPYKLGPH